MKKSSGLGDRFIEVMEQVGHTGYSLSRVLETSEAVISNIRKGKNPPNIQLVCRLLKKYEAVDPLWLLLGEGQMFRDGVSTGTTTTDQRPSPSFPDNMAERLEARLETIEIMLRRSFEAQLERAVLVDESIAELSQQVKSLTTTAEPIRKGRRGTA
jgi:hypothetical protein